MNRGMDSFTGEEIDVIYTCESRIVPFLKRYFKEASPELFEKYMGNCPRQISVISIKYIKSKLPNYTWEIIENLYDYCGISLSMPVIIGKSKDKAIILDLSRAPHSNNLIRKVPINKLNESFHDGKFKYIRQTTGAYKDVDMVREMFTGLLTEDLYGLTVKTLNL